MPRRRPPPPSPLARLCAAPLLFLPPHLSLSLPPNPNPRPPPCPAAVVSFAAGGSPGMAAAGFLAGFLLGLLALADAEVAALLWVARRLRAEEAALLWVARRLRRRQVGAAVAAAQPGDQELPGVVPSTDSGGRGLMAALPIPPATPTRANNKVVDAMRAQCRVRRLSGKPELGLHIVYQHPPCLHARICRLANEAFLFW